MDTTSPDVLLRGRDTPHPSLYQGGGPMTDRAKELIERMELRIRHSSGEEMREAMLMLAALRLAEDVYENNIYEKEWPQLNAYRAAKEGK
jgi:hypothetical protein